MKITFYQQSAVNSSEMKQTEKNRTVAESAESKKTRSSVFAGDRSESALMPEQQGEKGKSLIELQQEAANTDVAVQQDYMTLMSNTMSEEDYAKLQEEGFDFGNMEPEEAVTIVDKIKAELVRAGKKVAGYTDDLDVETLSAALGSQTLAQAVTNSFREADVPLTEENLSEVVTAWNVASGLQPMEDGSATYLIDNELESEIWNLYLAQNSAAGKGEEKLPEELKAQADRVLEQSGREVNEENRQRAMWLLERELPLTEDSLNQLEELEKLELPVSEERFAEVAAAAVAEGKNPVRAKLAGEAETLYQKAVRLEEYYQSDALWETSAGNLAARRQLEEIRLHMTAEVNVKLLKSGFSIDTAPMEELIEHLKAAEAELAKQYFPGDENAVDKYQTYYRVEKTVAEIPELPAKVLGTFAERQVTVTLEEFHRTGTELQQEYKKANESYETLMTSPRADMGDSIKKAFVNVDEILGGLGLETSEENRRAVRILAYNRMEMNGENLESVKEADRQVQSVTEKLTPAATLKMIRDGINPLEKSFGELETYFDSLPEEYEQASESYSRFLYGLEKNKEITPEERDSYIGIYRLVKQIEKSDGAVIGALVNTQAELHFSNLLSAVRSGKVKSLDIKVTEEMGAVVERLQKGESISWQISRAFVKNAEEVLTEVSYSATEEGEYGREQLEQYRSAVTTAESEVTAMLGRGELPTGGDNLLAAEMLLQGRSNLFAAADKKGKPQRESTGEKTKKTGASGESTNLWEILDDSDDFQEEYQALAEEAQNQTEQFTLEAEQYMDVRSMQLIHKQLTVVSALAKQEEFFLPMYVGDEIARVHLTVDRSGGKRGTVYINVNAGGNDSIEAQLTLEKNELQGIFCVRSQSEVMKLKKTADIFKQEAAESWSIGNISVVSAAAGLGKVEIGSDSGEETETGELYRVAKVFLQAVQKGVRTDEN